MKFISRFFIASLAIFGLIAAGAFAAVFNSSLGWVLFTFVLFVIVTSGLAILWPLKRIKVTTNQLVTVTAGEAVPIKLTLAANGWYWAFQLAVFLENTSQYTYLSFYHGEKKQLKKQLPPQKRGVYHRLQVSLLVSDWLGIFQKKQMRQLPFQLIVLPAKDKTAKSWSQGKVQQEVLFGERSLAVKHLRNYQIGDPLKQVDWKVTARKRQLMTRIFEEQNEMAIVFVFWGQASIHFEENLSRYYTLQKEFAGNYPIQQYLIGEEGAFLQGEKDFASLKAFEKLPPLANFIRRQLFVFCETAIIQPEFTQQVASWQQNNQVKVIDLQSLSSKTKEEEIR